MIASPPGWLAERLQEFREAASRADQALKAHQSRLQLDDQSGRSLLDEQINELNHAIIQTQARESRAKADLQQALRGSVENDLAGSSSILASPTIQALREQEAEILIKIGQLRQTLAEKHPSLIEAQAELEAARAKIGLEVDRIRHSLRVEVDATAQELQDLRAQLEALEAKRLQRVRAEAELAELRRDAMVTNEVYQQFLKQMNATVAQGAVQPADAYLADAARPPLAPSGPPRKLMLIGAGMLSVVAGTLAALGFGFWRGGFGGAAWLEQSTHLPNLELVCELGDRELAALLTGGSGPGVDGSLRSLALTLEQQLAGRQEAPTVLMTSSVPGEGKSITTLGVAVALALAGRRVLLVDLDLWRAGLQGLVQHLGPEPASVVEGALVEYRTRLPQLFLGLPRSRAGASGGQPAVRTILTELRARRGEFDFILIDAPPVLAIPEVLPMAAEADALLLLVRFEHTTAAQVRLALQKLATIGARPIGTVLTRVDPDQHRRYGYDEISYAATPTPVAGPLASEQAPRNENSGRVAHQPSTQV